MIENILSNENEEYKFDAGIIISSTDCKGIITFANRIFCEITGYTKDELVGSNHNIIRHPDVPGVIYKKMWDTISGGNVWSGVLKNTRKDGRYYWVYSKIIPVIENDIITGYTSARRPAYASEVEQAIFDYERINLNAA